MADKISIDHDLMTEALPAGARNCFADRGQKPFLYTYNDIPSYGPSSSYAFSCSDWEKHVLVFVQVLTLKTGESFEISMSLFRWFITGRLEHTQRIWG